MSTLLELSQSDRRWDIETFVEVGNRLLPQFLAEDKAVNQRSLEPVNPRLIRFYTSKGVLDRPEKEGREARYLYRHLLQLLLTRRLLSEGYSLAAIAPIIEEKHNRELESLLQGGIQITVETRNPALTFLHRVKSQQHRKPSFPQTPDSDLSTFNAPAKKTLPNPTDAPEVSQWKRIQILPGLELNIRQDFMPPATAQELENLRQLMIHKLECIFLSR